MTAAYWSQWDYSELMSMQGIELDEVNDSNLSHEENDTEVCQQRCNCGNCMDCLGFSWRDFM